MSAAPRLSIVITTHKALDYLKLCVQSILDDGEAGTEIVIYADGSGPETREYLESLARELEAERLVYRYEAQNVGISRATNRAAELAHGEWLYFVNDDMVFAPGFDTALLKHAKAGRVLTGTVVEPERPNLGVAAVHIKRDFGLYHTDFDPNTWREAAPQLAEDRLEPGINYPFCIERSFWKQLGGVDERFEGPLHDPDLFYRIALAGGEMLRVRDSLCYHFSGRSLRFEGEKPKVSKRWVEQETAGKLAFLEKWGERPQYRFGGVPQPGVQQPDQKWGLGTKLRIAVKAAGYRNKARKQMEAAE